MTSEPPWKTRTSAECCCFTTSGMALLASRYEEGLARGGAAQFASWPGPRQNSRVLGFTGAFGLATWLCSG